MTTHLRMRLAILLVGALLSMSQAASAEPPPPVAYPQWSTVFPREQLAADSIAPSAGPSWTRLPGGDTVVATAIGSGLVVRRFAADGSVLAVQLEALSGAGSFDFTDELIVKAAMAGDAIYVLAGSYQGRCEVMRFDTDLHREWSTLVPASDPFVGRCRALEVLPDDSVFTLRESSLARIDHHGHVSWSFKHGDGTHWFDAADLAVDAKGTIWIASRGGLIGSGANQASVLRFDMSGALLSADDFLCSTCVASYSMSVDALPDGTVAVCGGSGTSQPGFFARYAAGGERLLLVDTESDVRYSHLAHDLAGAIYVQAEGAKTEVRRIDAQTGTVLWTMPADEFTAMDSGIATSRTTATGIEVAVLDATGAPRWSRMVSSEANARASRGVGRDGALEILVLDSWLVSPTCGRSPRLLTLDDSGNLAALLHACAMPGAAMLDSIDAKASVGALANLGYRLIAYSPEGDLRWQVINCEWCDGFASGDPWWAAATLTEDGGAWAAERTLALPPLAGTVTIKRIDPNGQIIASLATAAQAASIPAIRLLGAAHDAIVLQPALSYGVTWQILSED
jgi:outer membrane protein assembly factor BamB